MDGEMHESSCSNLVAASRLTRVEGLKVEFLEATPC